MTDEAMTDGTTTGGTTGSATGGTPAPDGRDGPPGPGPGGPAVVIERTVEAPVGLVWQLWTDPRHFAAWYGPDGATIPSVTMDVRVGGERTVCMEVPTPGGPQRMWFTGEHLEVVPDVRLVYTESMADADRRVMAPSELGMPADHPTTTEVRVDLTSLGERTRMVLTHLGVPAGSPGEAGWRMALDALATLARSRSTG